MAETTKKLFEEFPAVTTLQWEERIHADLKGKDYEKALVWKTGDGISVRPYYRSEDLRDLDYIDKLPGTFPYVRGNKAGNDWLIRQDIIVSDFALANKKALEVLGKGVSSLGFLFDCKTRISPEDLKILLKDICLEAAEVNFVCPCKNCDISEAFTEIVKQGPWEIKNVVASIAGDPLGTLLLKGKPEDSDIESSLRRLNDQVLMTAELPKYRVIGVNGKIYGNSGASTVQELAFSLAQGAEYLTALTGLGTDIDLAASKIKFNLSTGNNYFMEIARLRAGRLLWAQIVKAFGSEKECSARMLVHAETGSYNKTVYDAYTNLLRTQTEAMSAALGGAHSVTVLPFDMVYQDSTAFSERIARNQQILLKEESNIDKIADPAGGSYYIENLTASVAEHAWKLFLEVQEAGGFISAVNQGLIQQKVKAMAGQRDQNLALRRENLLGINQFPNFGEVISQDLPGSVFEAADFRAEGAMVETLHPYRGAMAFEKLRYKTDQYAKHYSRPLAFMLTIGNPAMRKARAQFASNFFAVAGFEVMDNNGFETVEEGLVAARAAHAGIIVVCSSDEEYARLVPELNSNIGDEILVVAGNPACRPELEALGVKNFVHLRSNLLTELEKYQSMILEKRGKDIRF